MIVAETYGGSSVSRAMRSRSVTLLVVAYNQEQFVRDAVTSALHQDCAPIEIILSDDCSTDGTYEVMEALAASYAGPHRVLLNRSAQNRGFISHFNHVLELASGDILVYAAGDDVSLPHRVRTLVSALNSNRDLAFVESAYLELEGTVRLPPQIAAESRRHKREVAWFNLNDYMSGRAPRLSSSTRAFLRSDLASFPPLNTSLPSEDSASAVRLLFRGNGRRLADPLVLKRVHGQNLTGPAALRRMNFAAISDQYIEDATFALANGWIGEAQCSAAKTWAVHLAERRRLRVLFDLGYPTYSQLVGQILASRDLSPREKTYAARRFLAGLIGGGALHSGRPHRHRVKERDDT